MEKKWIALIFVIILLVVGLIAFYNFSTQENEVKIGNSTFKLPNGYFIGNSNNNITNLTDGTHEIYIGSYNDKNINKHVDSYVNDSMDNNRSIKISNFTVGKTLVYKSNIKDSKTVHYWFVKNKNTYNIYSVDKNSEIDSTVIKLIESVR